MSAVVIDRAGGSTAMTETFVLEPIAQRLGLAPVVLTPGSISIGSGAECDLRLTVPGVQEQHCLLQVTRARVSVRALDRRTWQNNLPITESWLRLGDRLAVGPVEFRVRAVEPWDLLPAAESDRPNSDISAVTAATEDFRPDDAAAHATIEAELLRQIATLEADVARHQAAVAKLEQQAAVTEAAHVVEAMSVSEPTETNTTVEAAAICPTMLVVPEVPSPPILDEHHERLLAAIDANYRESNRKLAELSVREHSLQRQFVELEAQWEQLLTLFAEQQLAAAECHRHEQHLSSREQNCELRETELESQATLQQSQADELTLRRQELEQTKSQLQQEAQRLDTQRAQLAARHLELETTAAEQAAWQQAEEHRLVNQNALLNEREQAATAWSSQLSTGQTLLEEARANLEQRQVELERREEDLRLKSEEAETQWRVWSQTRQAEEAELVRRRGELDVLHSRHELKAAELAEQAALLATQSDELARGRLEWEHQKDQLSQQLETERAQLDARIRELDTHATENETKIAELAEQAARQAAQAGELTRGRLELGQQRTQLQQDIQQLETERVQLDARIRELESQATENETKTAELAEQAARQAAQAGELTRGRLELDQQRTQLQQDIQQLETERTRLDARIREVSARETANEQRASELAEQFALHASQSDELTQRHLEVEQQKAQLQQESQQLEAEHAQLDARVRELDARTTQHHLLTAELDRRQQEFVSQVADVQHEQQQLDAERDRLTAWSVELTNSALLLAAETAGLSQSRNELIAARHELERVEVEVNDFENQLLDDEAELTRRDAALIQAEIECAWHERAWELAALNARPVPGEDARTEERLTETLSHVIEQLVEERDVLAKDLFATSIVAEAEIDDATTAAHRVRIEVEQLRVERETWQQHVAKLEEDRISLESERHELQRERLSLQQAQQQHESEWNAWQTEMAAKSEQLRTAGDALRLREDEFHSKWQELQVEQQNLRQLDESLRTGQAELTRLREDLERQLVEVSTQAARQQAEAAAQAAEFQQRETELEARSAALAEQEANWQAAQLELQQQRQAEEQERADWTRYQESQAEAELDSPLGAQALESISHLEELVETELNQDQFLADEDRDVPAWNAAEASDVPPECMNHDRDEYRGEAETTSPTDEELSASSLRAKLAEMFNLDLSKTVDIPEEPDAEEGAFSLESDEPQEAAADAGEVVPPVPSLAAVAEPDAEEYDSVESYMQRLLDRNRLSREGLEASREGHSPMQTMAAVAMESRKSRDVTEVMANQVDLEEETVSEPDRMRIPVARPVVDHQKVRAGLLSLRQVANDSARSAIARSKWNKMRTRLFIEGTLAVVCGAVGGTIVAGQWLDMVGTSLWGWVAIAMGLGLGTKILWSVYSIYDVDRSERIPEEQPPETTAPPAAV